MKNIPYLWISMALFLYTSLAVVNTSLLHPAASHKISNLPGQPPMSFQQFAGYITIDQKKQRALFYYFVEAETNPASKPLVLWLNGGPGCSSVGAGLFCEHGPYTPSGDILLKNNFSWSPLQESDSPTLLMSLFTTLWSHGLISDSTFLDFTKVCNFSQIRREAGSNSLTPVCLGVHHKVSREISRFVNSYDVTSDVCLPAIVAQSQVLNQMHDAKKIDVCAEDKTLKYLNRIDVQRAIHAQREGVTSWTICSNVLRYEMKDLEIPIIPVLTTLVKSGIRVLVYSGDQDSVIPLTGTRTLVDGLAKELDLNMTVPYRVWFEGRQVAGWTQVYSDIQCFATIRGASHEAPFSQPERSLVLFKTFLRGQPLPANINA